MKRMYLRSSILMLMVLAAGWGVFFGISKMQQADPTTAALDRIRAGNVPQRRQVANELGGSEFGPELAVPALIAALKDPSEDVRWTAVFSLGSRGVAAAPAVPALALFLKDPSPRMRRAAA
jgi:HEAT repeat protein